jgi:hypothetical protein
MGGHRLVQTRTKPARSSYSWNPYIRNGRKMDPWLPLPTLQNGCLQCMNQFPWFQLSSVPSKQFDYIFQVPMIMTSKYIPNISWLLSATEFPSPHIAGSDLYIWYYRVWLCWSALIMIHGAGTMSLIVAWMLIPPTLPWPLNWKQFVNSVFILSYNCLKLSDPTILQKSGATACSLCIFGRYPIQQRFTVFNFKDTVRFQSHDYFKSWFDVAPYNSKLCAKYSD